MKKIQPAIFTITKRTDKELSVVYTKAMKTLNRFYGFNWVHHMPNLFVVPDRKTIDMLKGGKTERWIIGWSEGRGVFVLDNSAMAKESKHKKHTPEQYASLITHELSHAFYKILSKGTGQPRWLWEGVAIYTSKQKKFFKKSDSFKTFLNFYEEGGQGVYAESGFVVELLVKKFGKEKLFSLIKKLPTVTSQTQFNSLFRKTYGFKLSYEAMNKLRQ